MSKQQTRCVSCGEYITDETNTIICSQCQKQITTTTAQSKIFQELLINGVG